MKENINLSFEQLEKIALQTENVKKTNLDILTAYTGNRTSRSPNDRYIVQNILNKKSINWGEYNQPISKDKAQEVKGIIVKYLMGVEHYIFEGFIGAEKVTKSVRVCTDKATQAMFCDIMLEKKNKNLQKFTPYINVVCASTLKLNYKALDINSEAIILIDLKARSVYIAGTGYTCEIKKSIFAILNYYLPKNEILTMHCSANCDNNGKNTALFFGLSGTGKTTLSTSDSRRLVGDDEHIMTDKNVINIENGCYAKCIGLKPEKEPQIYNAIKKGAMLENVPIVDGVPKFLSAEITENTRAIYPLKNVQRSMPNKTSGLPTDIFFLSADAEGVFPPISKLDKEQIEFYFLSGYTSKLAGTENNIVTPQAVFSACFGEPFMPLKPKIYVKILLQKIKKHNINVYLVNTGWYGGPFGIGQRIPLACTRSLVDGAINGDIDKVEYIKEPYFNLSIPKSYKEWTSLLNPIDTWKNRQEYIKSAQRIMQSIKDNYKKY
ncbi:MAG: phosphoenolpyruvate carboxykinase (ATP) [Clostridia bacterium]|jgi:phosphoenolpyruvate carboxykinase (ATP)|nr:phosphoenolpyruvate carboxykinase (ATP) [Clostridia bacterium]